MTDVQGIAKQQISRTMDKRMGRERETRTGFDSIFQNHRSRSTGLSSGTPDSKQDVESREWNVATEAKSAAYKEKASFAETNHMIRENIASKADTMDEASEDTFAALEPDQNVPEVIYRQILEFISMYTGQELLEIQNLMETVGMEPVDLLDRQNLNMLTANLMGKESIMDLLTDSNGSQMVLNLTQEVAKITENLELMMQQGISKSDVLMSETSESELTQMVMKHQQVELDVTTKSEVREELQENVQLDEEGILSTDAENAITADEKYQQGTNEQELFRGDTTSQDNGRNSVSERQTGSNGVEQNQQNSMVTILEQLETRVSEALPEEHRVQDTYKIMQQIQDTLLVRGSSDMKSMEMQLEPEHLGKLTISILSKNGHVTAQIEAETRIAKEVIEGQLAQLKDHFQQQGIKVASVEVTVASHEFEQNLKQGEEHTNRQGQRKSRRGISLDTLEDVDEEVRVETLEETVIQDLGTNVSYLA